MFSDPHDVAPVVGPSRRIPRAARLLQAAALAAVLVPLGTVAVEADSIMCNSSMSGGGCFGSGEGSSHYSSGVFQSTEWDFYSPDLKYSFTISGTPTSDFTLSVMDQVTTQTYLLGNGGDVQGVNFLANSPGLTCVSTYGPSQCGLFVVTTESGTPSWTSDGYTATIIWYPNSDPLSQPLAGSFVTILQAKDGTNGVFGNELQDIVYTYDETPGDPGISGRGDGFSTFGVFTSTVPEPASMVLLGAGLAVGAIYRARRRGRQS